MTKEITRLVLVMMMALLAVACVTRRPIVGRDIFADRVREIQPGSTTNYEIVEWFGPPDGVLHYPDGSQEYRYSYTGWQDRRLELLVYSHTTTEKEYKSLSIQVQNGVVTKVRYSNSANPRENLTR
jgi:hypothetical protein